MARVYRNGKGNSYEKNNQGMEKKIREDKARGERNGKGIEKKKEIAEKNKIVWYGACVQERKENSYEKNNHIRKELKKGMEIKEREKGQTTTAEKNKKRKRCSDSGRGTY